MIIPLVPFLSPTKAFAAAGIPLVASNDMTQPPPMTTCAPPRLLTATNNQSLLGFAPVLKISVIGEHSAAARASRRVVASGAAFITPDALNPILYRVEFVLAAALPHT